MEIVKQDSIEHRKKAVVEVGRQLEQKLPGFFGKILLHFQNGLCGHQEIVETVKPETEKRNETERINDG